MLILITAHGGYAQQPDNALGKKAPLAQEPTSFGVETSEGTSDLPESTGWIIVDTMQTTYSTAHSTLNPLAYDPASNMVALVHRSTVSYATSSYEIWYNISTNRGVNWKRVPKAVNHAITLKMGLYPSMAISNPNDEPVNKTTGLFVWADIIPGWTTNAVGFATDYPLGNATPSSFIDNSIPYGFMNTAWCSSNTPWMFWTACYLTNPGIKLFRKRNLVSVDTLSPPAWSSAVFQDNGSVPGGGASALDGTLYFAVVGSFVPPDSGNPIVSGWFPGVSKSTDNGATWGSFEVIDFRQIPALRDYDRLFDYIKGDSFVQYNCDINVDKYNHPHLLISVTDTIGNANSGTNALVEIFKNSEGQWDGKVIYSGIPDNAFRLNGPAVGQMGPSGYLSMDKTRNIMVAQWVTPVQDDSICDILMSWRKVDDLTWSAPINITNTPGMNENNSHLAPYLAGGESQGYVTAFSLFNYAIGYSGYWPNGSIYDTKKSLLFVKPVTIALSPVPFAPSDLVASNEGTRRIRLVWEDNALNETSYSMERKAGDTTSTAVYEIIATTAPNTVTFIDTLVSDSTTYTYRVKAFNGLYSSGYSNQSQIVTLVSVINYDEQALPSSFFLSRNYPNPFNPSTTLSFELPRRSTVKLMVFNARGESVSTVTEGVYEPGRHEVTFDAAGLPSGIYFYRLQAGEFVQTKKMVLMR